VSGLDTGLLGLPPAFYSRHNIDDGAVVAIDVFMPLFGQCLRYEIVRSLVALSRTSLGACRGVSPGLGVMPRWFHTLKLWQQARTFDSCVPGRASEIFLFSHPGVRGVRGGETNARRDQRKKREINAPYRMFFCVSVQTGMREKANEQLGRVATVLSPKRELGQRSRDAFVKGTPTVSMVCPCSRTCPARPP